MATLVLPPLRERPEEIAPLTDYFLRELTATLGRTLTLTDAARKKLRFYHYPGNVRELKNILRRAAVLSDGRMIRDEQIGFTDPHAQEAFAIYQSIAQHGGVTAAARKLGTSRQTLYRKLKRYTI